jgi:hypothetical protein
MQICTQSTTYQLESNTQQNPAKFKALGTIVSLPHESRASWELSMFWQGQSLQFLGLLGYENGTIFIEKNVSRFEIPVNDSLFMDLGDTRDELEHQFF